MSVGLVIAALGEGRPAGAATPPDAAVSDRSSTAVVARRGPRAAKSVAGTGQRQREDVPAIAGFAGPVLGNPRPFDPANPYANSILGFDTRSQVFDSGFGPQRMVALITNGGHHWCTGFLIGPSTVATAGHCLHSGGGAGQWYPASALRVYPAYNRIAANPAPFGSCGAVSLHATAGWTQSGDDQYDYGAIRLDCAVGLHTGWFGWWAQTATLDAQLTRIVGYPGDKPLEPWKSKDVVRVSERRRVFHANDTAGGNSGSPVFRLRGPNEAGCQGFCVMAVHGYGVYGTHPFATYNHGARVTQEVSDNFFLWRGG